MRRLFSLLAILVCLITFPACTDDLNTPSVSDTTTVTTTVTTTCTTTVATTVATTSDKAQMTVYITNTGECYHLDGCRSLWNSKIAVTLEQAVRRHYRACQICLPPRLP